MALGLIFWIIMLLWLLFGLWGTYAPPATTPWLWPLGGHLMLFLLLLILGWGTFGAPVHG